MTRSPGAAFRDLLAGPDIVLLAGVHDALSARIAERAGCPAAYVTGSGVAMSLLAVPDLGLMSGTEMLDQVRRITDATSMPLIADADTGYGNAVNVRRTVASFEAAGVAGIQLEDQGFPKRCGHFEGKSVIDTAEMVGKIRSAVAAREDPAFVIVARTDALATDGLGAAIDRARAYADAGADVLFVEAPRTIDELDAIGAITEAPTLVNVVEGGRTPQLPAADYQAMGFRIVLYPTAAVRVVARALGEFYQGLRTTGSSRDLADRMVGFDERDDITGKASYDEWGDRFGPPPPRRN